MSPVNRVLNVLRVPVGIRQTAVSNHDAPPTFKTLKTFVRSWLSSRMGRWTCQYPLFAVVGWTPDTAWYRKEVQALYLALLLVGLALGSDSHSAPLPRWCGISSRPMEVPSR